MSEEIQNHINEELEDDIDIMGIIKRLWSKKVLIARITLICGVLGFLVAIFSPKVFTAGCTFVPQTKSSSGSKVSSLAALAGINLGDMTSAGESLSPVMYPQLLENVYFLKDLMHIKVNFEEWEEPVSVLDYYTNPDFKKTNFNPVGILMKYTIGLPGVIMKAVRGEQPMPELPDSGEGSKILVFTKEEYECAKIIKEKILSIEMQEKKGYMSISVNMPEPVAAAQLAQRTFELLQDYVTEFKIQKAAAQYDYVSARFEEAKADFEKKQEIYAKFQDANRILTSASAKTEEERLKNEYNLASQIFLELGRQKIQTELQVKEDTPILTPVKPVSVPNRKTKPKRAQILAGWLFVGLILGCSLVLGFDYLRRNGVSWPKGWRSPEEDEALEAENIRSGVVPPSFWKQLFTFKLL